jgi:hypothetical protein
MKSWNSFILMKSKTVFRFRHFNNPGYKIIISSDKNQRKHDREVYKIYLLIFASGNLLSEFNFCKFVDSLNPGADRF